MQNLRRDDRVNTPDSQSFRENERGLTTDIRRHRLVKPNTTCRVKHIPRYGRVQLKLTQLRRTGCELVRPPQLLRSLKP